MYKRIAAVLSPLVWTVALAQEATQTASQTAKKSGLAWWVWLIIAVVVVAIVFYFLKGRGRGKEG